MTVPTVQTRVLEELRRSGLALDDDQLAKRLGVSPRQTINQVCRRLETAGRLHRYVGADGKIVNELRHTGDDVPSLSSTRQTVEAVGDLPPGSSHEQRRAESVMLALLGERLGLTLRPLPIPLAERGIRVEVDGADEAMTTLVEVWAHQGPPKPAQKNKVLTDALKLIYIAKTLDVTPRLILCLSDIAAAHHFTAARSWAADALRAFGIEIEVVDLPSEVRNAVLTAQKRQFR
jgi:hypothetical protein